MSTEKKNRPDNMTAEDQAALSAAGDAYNNAKTDDERVAAHAEAEAIRSKYNYSGGADGSQVIKTNNSEDEARKQSYVDVVGAANKANNTGLADAALNALKNSNPVQPLPQPVPQAPVQSFTAQVPDFTGLLDKWLESAKTQQQTAIDYATNKGVADLERAEEDAQEQFQTQQNQISEDEAKALDNQALYAEARGDKGGIGQAQYAQIQATAMTNRRAVNSARTKLSTDTARAIADLRAQGEFEKADALLQLGQTYLGQLIELQQWGAEYAMDVAQFNAQLQQWQAEFNLQAQKYTDSLSQWQMEWDYNVSQNEKAQLAESGLAALAVGIRPSAAQQQAMGYTDAQVNAALSEYQLAKAAGTKVSSGGGGGKPVSGSNTTGLNVLQQLYADKVPVSQVRSLLIASGEYTATEAAAIAEDYEMNYDELGQQVADILGLYDYGSLDAIGYGKASENEILAAINSGLIERYFDPSDGYYRFRKTQKAVAAETKNTITGDIAGHQDWILSPMADKR